MSELKVRGWYLELIDRTKNHEKFYTVLVCQDVTFIQWGRIGTAGQHKVQHLPSTDKAQEVALRQVYSKAADGYLIHENDFAWVVDEEIFGRASEGSPHLLTDAFTSARVDDRFRGAQASVLEFFDGVIDEAQSIITDIKNGADLETLRIKHKNLRAAVEGIDDKYAVVQVQVQIAQQMLAAYVNGGS